MKGVLKTIRITGANLPDARIIETPTEQAWMLARYSMESILTGYDRLTPT